MSQRKLFIIALLCGCAILIADFWSKAAIRDYFLLQENSESSIPVFNILGGLNFSLIYTPNKGAAWGILSSWQTPLLIVRLFAIAGLFIYILYFNKLQMRIIPLTFIVAGAIGNVIDTFLYGHVVDMLFFNFWGFDFAVFNVADSAITLGVIMLMGVLLLEPKEEKCTVR